LIYRGLVLVRGTRAATMLAGLSLILVLYFIARQIGLVTVAWLFSNVLSSIILVVVVLFQDELRRGLTKVGLQPILHRARPSNSTIMTGVEDIVITCGKLSKAKLGALIVIKKDVGLDHLLGEAVLLDAVISRKLLFGIFIKDSPLHDGAVIIEGGRIKAAGAVLPLSDNPDLDPNLGTRHRAALGISEQCDALVIVVSETNGSISVAKDGKLLRNFDTLKLKEWLLTSSGSDSKAVAMQQLSENRSVQGQSLLSQIDKSNDN
jgi:diadenylate cyclase